MRGRKPKPTALKELDGNPGKRALPENEPRPPAPPQLPPAPTHMSNLAKREWRRVGKQLLTLGLFTGLDHAALTAYCVAWARHVEAEEHLAEFGTVLASGGGTFYQSPYVSISNKAIEIMYKIGGEFGFTPVARARIQTQVPEEEPDELERLRAERAARKAKQ